MRVRAARYGFFLLAGLLVSCGSARVSAPGDSGVQPCQDDQDCELGYACTGGYCQAITPVDGGVIDAPAAAKMLVSPTLLDFGNAYVGGEFTKTFTIANVGQGTLTVQSMNLVEDRTVGAFTVQSKPVPFTVEAGGTETVTVVLRPNDANLPTGSIKIHSDDPDSSSADATVDLISRSKGSPDLGVCSNNPTPPPDCQLSTDNNPVIDYGEVPYGSSVERLVDIRNIGDGNLPIEITEISLTNPAHFNLTIFELVEDPLNPGQLLERGVTLPFLLSVGDESVTPPVPPTVLRVHVRFTAVGIDTDVPHESLLIKYSLPESPTSVPIVGTIRGCIPTPTDAGVPDGGADPQTDPNNCGTCGHKCVVANGTAGCQGGFCTVAACNPGFQDCNNNPDDGCEKNLTNDPDNCGACSVECSNVNMLTRTCQGGECNGTCATGYADCNNNKQTDGCESELATDPNNCSVCGMSCSNNHMATRTCHVGVCDGTCANGYADCDGDKQSNGCEINLQSDVTHCGSCATNCSSLAHPNATAVTCAAGACAVTTCTGGWYDQDGVFSNGCECQADSILNTCTQAHDLGTIGLDGNLTLSSYNLTPTLSDQDWFKVAFATGTCSWGPKVVLSSTAPASMRVYTNCSNGTTACTEGGTSGAASGYRSWEAGYSSTCADMASIDPTPATGSFINSASLPANQTFYIQVFATASTTTCAPYTLTISN
jgi:hypothetical protein